jgi:3-phosphoshikimate 1-carboxyvinyltransferase
MRPLTAVLSSSFGEYILDGTPRMRERPIKDLIDGLLQLGVEITCSPTGCPPVHIHGKGLQGGQSASISGKISSQYLSALLMASPLAQGTQPTLLRIQDELMSAPYVLMTVKLMEKFGAKVDVTSDLLQFTCYPIPHYTAPSQIFIEGDASSASYFLAGAAITKGGKIKVYGCGEDSIQGDARFARVLEKMGAKVYYGPNYIQVEHGDNHELHGIDEDCGDIPDVAMTLAIVGIFAKGKTTIRNVYNWRVKETERMVAMVTELQKLGVMVEEGRDYLVVHGLKDGQQLLNNIDIHTYDDHRVAMCFALAACGGVSVNILDPGCTSKTFPDYFDQLKAVTL